MRHPLSPPPPAHRVAGTGMVLAVATSVVLLIAADASPQTCAWGGSSALPLPAITPLRAYSDLLHSPVRIATDPQGDLYVADPGNGRVVVWSPSGRLLSMKQGLSTPLAVAADGRQVWVAEQGTGSVSVFDRRWNLQYRLGRGEGEFLVPNDIALDLVRGAATVWVTDGAAHAVKVFTAEGGAPVRAFGGLGSGEGQFDVPAAVHVSAAGEVFVADQANDRIQVFSRGGDFQRCIGTTRGDAEPAPRFGRILGLTSDSRGRLYVADAFQGHVVVLDPQGATVATLGGFGEGPGQLRTPAGLAIDGFNRLLVASANSGRVDVFGLDEFADPRVARAEVGIAPSVVDAARLPRTLTVWIEFPGQPASARIGAVTANGVAPGRPPEFGDYDRDGIADFTARFDTGAVLRPGAGIVVVRVGGQLGGAPFEGVATVRVIAQKVSQ